MARKASIDTGKKIKDTSSEYDDFVGKKDEKSMPGTLEGFLGEKIEGPITEQQAWQKLWKDMPRHKANNTEPVKSLTVHFDTWEDYWKFGKATGQSLTEKTKKMYWPPKSNMIHDHIRWVNENDENEDLVGEGTLNPFAYMGVEAEDEDADVDFELGDYEE